jgi:hypothetical protein
MGLKHNIALWSAITFTAFTSGLTVADRWRPEIDKVAPVVSCMGNIAGDEGEEIVYLEGNGIYYIQDRGSKKPIGILKGAGLNNVCGMALNDFDGNGLEDLTLHFNDQGTVSVLTYANFGKEGFFYDPNGFNYEPLGHTKRTIYQVREE